MTYYITIFANTGEIRMNHRLQRCKLGLILMIGLFTLSFAHTDALAQTKDLLVKVEKDGKETSIYQKLISNKTTQVHDEPRAGSRVKRISAFNIFYRLKTESGQTEQDGFYRIGDMNGNHLGWVSPEDVAEWNTRFVVQPKMVSQDITFGVDVDGDGKNDYAWDTSLIPSDVTAYSFITGAAESTDADAEESGPFPVFFCLTRLEDEGTLSELNQLGDLKLEIVFAIEATGYLGTKYDGEKPFIDYLNDLAKNLVDSIRTESDADLPVRFGLVVFQDASSNYRYRTPSILQPLTDDLDQWKSKLAAIKYPTANEDILTDTPNDGASAVYKSLSSDLGWTSNSSKHVVLIGHNPFQIYGKMKGGKPPANTQFSFLYDRSAEIFTDSEATWLEKFGYNTSGKSIDDLFSLARPHATTLGAGMRLRKNIHTVHVGQTVRQLFGDEIMDSMDEVNEAVDKVARENGEVAMLDVFFSWIDTQPALFTAVVIAQKIAQLDAYDQIAESNYQTLGQDGYSTHIDPTSQDVVRAMRELRDEINEAINVISDVAKGKEQETEKDREATEFTKPLFRMIRSTMKRSLTIKVPVLKGTARLTDEETGQSVGEIQVMIGREEAIRLKGTFNFVYEQFSQKRERIDRQDIGLILADLQESLASVVTGQRLDTDVDLAAFISELPIRTETLRLTSGDIAAMSVDHYDQWLEKLATATERLDKLVAGDQPRWISISTLGGSRQLWAMIRLSDLP